jgi:hypothetical protein
VHSATRTIIYEIYQTDRLDLLVHGNHLAAFMVSKSTVPMQLTREISVSKQRRHPEDILFYVKSQEVLFSSKSKALSQHIIDVLLGCAGLCKAG